MHSVQVEGGHLDGKGRALQVRRHWPCVLGCPAELCPVIGIPRGDRRSCGQQKVDHIGQSVTPEPNSPRREIRCIKC